MAALLFVRRRAIRVTPIKSPARSQQLHCAALLTPLSDESMEDYS